MINHVYRIRSECSAGPKGWLRWCAGNNPPKGLAKPPISFTRSLNLEITYQRMVEWTIHLRTYSKYFRKDPKEKLGYILWLNHDNVLPWFGTLWLERFWSTTFLAQWNENRSRVNSPPLNASLSPPNLCRCKLLLTLV